MKGPLRRRFGFTIGSLVAFGALVACQIVAGLEAPTFVDPPPPDGGSEAGAVDPCAPEVPAPRPAAPSPDVGTTTFAMEYVDIASPFFAGDTARLCPSAALDLDDFDTCAEVSLEDGGRHVVGNSCRAIDLACDSVGGGDSNLGAVVAGSVGSTPREEDDANFHLRSGHLGVLLELSDYNGLPDDERVSVALIQSVGVVHPDGTQPGPDGGGAAPTFAPGADEWVPRAESLIDNSAPLYSVRDAYVVSDVLVARFTGRGTPIDFGGSASNLIADEVYLTAKIERDEEGRPARLDKGRVALRIPAETIFEYAAGRLAGGNSVCDDTVEGAGLRRILGNLVCRALDLPSGARAAPTDELCGSISYGVGFYAVRARRTTAGVKTMLPDAGGKTQCPPTIPWPPRCDEFAGGG